ncbi:cation-translocating P-type ATPase [Sinisalibacter aestuarii]|uniref:Calcium-transporting P-type ATPase, PMR1-type n=1 Tax=Sinisalibacter aestuarii TaxID=2949426 RepID=A0ABQ5LSR3_9RHOB|nr:cation-transporting P-type ATPase [Sinisalibacter aestuarii]GKY87460.1 calcium-transporting P-type ATPase, PMR1-type [Sinisalibacter aestuarii]
MQVKRNDGLTSAEALARLEQYGPNTLGETKRVSWAAILARQFTGLLVVILIVAAVIAAALGEVIDAVAIGLVVVLNGILGFVQEWQAENALEALRSMLAQKARVLRDGSEELIDTAEIVPGDVVLLSAGDKVPADLDLLTTVDLRVDESALTGESLPVSKSVGDPEPKLFMGTAVVAGHAEAQVVATGRATAFGEIAELTTSVGEKTTHLQVVLAGLARQMAIAALGLAAVVAGAGLYTGHGLHEMFLMALSLAVAIVLEGLPAVVTITLALGAAAMVRKQALARRLQAVETLGAASVICTDKTGTLTEDKMTATRIWTPGGAYRVTGGGYDPAGHIETEDGQRVRAEDDDELSRLLETAMICNRARIERGETGWTMHGTPTEAALVTLAYKGWCPVPEGEPVVAELPFTSERKRMSVLAAWRGAWILQVKGAPERILERATRYRLDGEERDLTAGERARFTAAYEAIAAEGVRVIALAQAIQPGPTPPVDEQDLTFLGFVGLMDPPRAEVKAAIRAARAAGIRVIMITGDGAATAKAVAGMVGLEIDRVLSGRDVEALSDEELDAALEAKVLFARTAPAHKMRLVRALQAKGQIVAMTGDGVNDAPALKQSDIGVAMGVRGTDVARDAADLVLLDDNFATIVRAVREGRRQFENVRKFVRYLLSSNAGEVVALLVNILIGGPLIFLATQILWMNLITDGVTAVALGLEKATPDTMNRPPRRKNESVIGKAGFAMILAFGSYTGAASLWIFYHFLGAGADEAVARTVAFTAMVFFEKISVFAFRSFHHSCTEIGWFSNRLLILALLAMVGAQLAAVYWAPLQQLLRAAPLGWEHWQMIALFALPLLVVPEAVKMIRRRTNG